MSRYGARIYAALAALMPLCLQLWPNVPWEAVLAASAALLGTGAAVAWHEDTKTIRALYQESPFDKEANHSKE
ncbi:hypothetical protein GA0115243_104755 [Streptomyces sp. ScaeMP-e83]|nr:hypothetical protein GA0115243_104755 [Streptomyces sp. ScaeMP-e83]